MLLRRPFVVLASILLLCACNSGVEPPADAPENQRDHDALAACGDLVCPEGSAQRIEGGSPFAMYDMPCIIEGLRDRKSDLYRVALDHTFSNGSERTVFTLFVTPSGAAEVAARSIDSTDGSMKETLEPTQRCTLRPVSYFDACLVAAQAGEGPDATDDAWNCVYPGGNDPTEQVLPWFESCEAQSPACQ